MQNKRANNKNKKQHTTHAGTKKQHEKPAGGQLISRHLKRTRRDLRDWYGKETPVRDHEGGLFLCLPWKAVRICQLFAQLDVGLCEVDVFLHWNWNSEKKRKKNIPRGLVQASPSIEAPRLHITQLLRYPSLCIDSQWILGGSASGLQATSLSCEWTCFC